MVSKHYKLVKYVVILATVYAIWPINARNSSNIHYWKSKCTGNRGFNLLMQRSMQDFMAQKQLEYYFVCDSCNKAKQLVTPLRKIKKEDRI